VYEYSNVFQCDGLRTTLTTPSTSYADVCLFIDRKCNNQVSVYRNTVKSGITEVTTNTTSDVTVSMATAAHDGDRLRLKTLCYDFGDYSVTRAHALLSSVKQHTAKNC